MTDLEDPERLKELAELDLGGDVDDAELRALVDEAREVLGMPLAAVSIVLDSAQYFIAHAGIEGWIAEAGGTPIEWSFCRHAVVSGHKFEVNEATRDPHVRDNPLVRNDGLRSYLGVPLVTSREQPIGAVCVLGSSPRAFSRADIEHLEDIASRVVERLELRRLST